MTKPATHSRARPSAWAVAFLVASSVFALTAAGLLGFMSGAW